MPSTTVDLLEIKKLPPSSSPQTKVLMLGWEYPPLINGGLGIACHGLSEALAAHLDLTMVLPHTVTSSPTHSGPSLVGLNISSAIPLINPYEDSAPLLPSTKTSLYQGDLLARVHRYAQATVAYARSTDFDIIHAHDWMTALAGLEIQKETGKPLVFHIHSLSYDRAGPDERGWIYDLEKRAIAQAQLVISVSHYTRDICIQHYAGSPNKIFTVHNGVEQMTTFRAPRNSPKKLVLFLGRLTAQKAPHSFLKIAARLLKANDSVKFALAGIGDQLPSLIAECAALGITNKVRFLGFQNRSEVSQILSQTDVYCMPSTSEPFGISALEAAQFSVPVVLSKQCGAAEVLTHAPSAEAWDHDQMAALIQELLTDSEIHQKTSQALFAEQKKCTWERAAEQINGLYQMHSYLWTNY